MMKRFALLLFVPFIAFCAAPLNPDREHPPMSRAEENAKMGLPWLTGPLLTPSGHVVRKGHFNIEPYIFYTRNYAKYDTSGKKQDIALTRQCQIEIPIQFGVASFVEMDVIPVLTTNLKGSRSYTGLGDTQVNLKFQVYNRKKGWFPSSNVFFSEIFPTGQYHHLTDTKSEYQHTGLGAYTTQFGYGATQLYFLGGDHYLTWRTAISYGISSRVHVKGFNAYGGGYGTNGYVYPGNTIQWFFGMEFTMNKHWALACDLEYFNQNRIRFKGTPGVNKDGTTATNTSPSSYYWALAPALEYNFNEHVGIIAGTWFTVAGRNATAFTSFSAAINIYY